MYCTDQYILLREAFRILKRVVGSTRFPKFFVVVFSPVKKSSPLRLVKYSPIPSKHKITMSNHDSILSLQSWSRIQEKNFFFVPRIKLFFSRTRQCSRGCSTNTVMIHFITDDDTTMARRLKTVGSFDDYYKLLYLVYRSRTSPSARPGPTSCSEVPTLRRRPRPLLFQFIGSLGYKEFCT